MSSVEKPGDDTYISTWAEGQATARLDRRLAKKRQQARAPTTPSSSEPRMVLLHGDVLDLPVPALAEHAPLEAPDIVASLNYAMAYFHDRATLLRYLRGVVKSLRPKTGVFITDMFGGPPTGEVYEDQEALWAQFWDEPGFRREQDGAPQVVLRANKEGDDLQVLPVPLPEQRGTRAEWPRGRLKLVRTGDAHGGFEYWREDGPIDYATNRFRMSLSFRFSDHSWLRDVFSYDFRIWSLKEVCTASKHSHCPSSQKPWKRQGLPPCASWSSHETMSTIFRALTSQMTTMTTLLLCCYAPRKKRRNDASSIPSNRARKYSRLVPLPRTW